MKINAHGTVLNLGDALVSPTYTAIAQVETFDGPELARGSEEVPTHDDADMVERIADALFRMNAVSGTLLYDPVEGTHDGATGLVSLLESGEERPFQLILSDAASTQWDFNGFVSQFSPTGLDANTGKLRADFEITPMNTPALA